MAKIDMDTYQPILMEHLSRDPELFLEVFKDNPHPAIYFNRFSKVLAIGEYDPESGKFTSRFSRLIL